MQFSTFMLVFVIFGEISQIPFILLEFFIVKIIFFLYFWNILITSIIIFFYFLVPTFLIISITAITISKLTVIWSLMIMRIFLQLQQVKF